MIKCIVVFLLVLLTLGCQAHINLGTCVLQCDSDEDDSPRTIHHDQSNRFQGSSGNQGLRESDNYQGPMRTKDDREIIGLKGDRKIMESSNFYETIGSENNWETRDTEDKWETTKSKGDREIMRSNDDPATMGSSDDPGPMGLKGDQGPKGEKGDPAEKCNCNDDVEDFKRSMFAQTCSDVPSKDGVKKSGIYTIYPYGNGDLTHLRVYCDMETDGGGWMVFQKRMDGSVDFFKSFNEYVRGFGNLDGEFWLGLNPLHKLTKDGGYKLRIDMEDFENQTRYAVYNDFVVGAANGYRLTFGDYNGTAGAALQSARFSAKDRDQDESLGSSCSQDFKGGWWYHSCHRANPNGLYLGGPHESFADGIEWGPWRGQRYSLKRMEMKFKKM